MKRIIMLLIAAVLLVACGSNKGIEDDEFTFGKTDIINIYEDESDRLMTGTIEVDGGSIKLEDMDKEETIGMLESIGELTNDKKMDKAINTFKEGNEMSVMTDKLSVLVVDHEDSYTTFVFTKMDEDEDATN